MYNYRFEVTRIIDGDTVDGIIDLGFDILTRVRVRLAGIDTPESRTRNLEEKKYGIEAKEKLEELIDAADELSIQSHGKGKFGRVLGTLYNNGNSINQTLIDEGYAIEYRGSRKMSAEELILVLNEVRSARSS